MQIWAIILALVFGWAAVVWTAIRKRDAIVESKLSQLEKSVAQKQEGLSRLATSLDAWNATLATALRQFQPIDGGMVDEGRTGGSPGPSNEAGGTVTLIGGTHPTDAYTVGVRFAELVEQYERHIVELEMLAREPLLLQRKWGKFRTLLFGRSSSDEEQTQFGFAIESPEIRWQFTPGIKSASVPALVKSVYMGMAHVDFERVQAGTLWNWPNNRQGLRLNRVKINVERDYEESDWIRGVLQSPAVSKTAFSNHISIYTTARRMRQYQEKNQAGKRLDTSLSPPTAG